MRHYKFLVQCANLYFILYMPNKFSLKFDNRFAALPSVFYTKMEPEKVARDPFVVHTNKAAAKHIGLSPKALQHSDFAAIFSGDMPLKGGNPLAMVYSGHQFGQWAGQLGDGRALLLGQVHNKAGELWDIQLKGGGKTPYSRMGDGRAVLRSCIREYLCSAAMEALGIPTTLGLCVIGTASPVMRETMEPGAVFTRLAQSHIRFGHFEHFFYRNEPQYVKTLADYVIAEHFKELNEHTDKYALWFAEIVKRTAQMIAKWQAVGFCHGVMNTDNISVLGLTLDYGPFGFMEAFDMEHICNHSDHTGRYAYDQQPAIGLWNLHAFAYALQPILSQQEALEILKNYDTELTQHYEQLMQQKLGLKQSDSLIWKALIQLMAKERSDYTLTFRYLADSFTKPETWLNLFADKKAAQLWLTAYHGKVDVSAVKKLNAVNPKFVLRNWVAEIAIRAAEDNQDYSVLDTVLTILQSPYKEHPEHAYLATPAPLPYQDLCVSCSS